jgi:voltage-gated potassium channel
MGGRRWGSATSVDYSLGGPVNPITALAENDATSQRTAPYQLFMLVLCLWGVGSLATDSVFVLDPETRSVLNYADDAVCGLFFLDFLWNLYSAERRWHYLVSWGWIDLLSSIPTVNALRWGRTARVMRILRVLRGVKSARRLAHFLVERREQSAFLATLLLALLLLVFAAIAMLEFETTADSNIRTAEDALWWAMSTMTTVGYGDTYPKTAEGRLVAVFLMAAGVGLFGTFSGLIASWFLSPATHETDSHVEELKAMIADLQRRLPPPS